MSAGDIDLLLGLWAASLAPHDVPPPFRDHREMYKVIDRMKLGDIIWDSFTLHYNGERPDGFVPTWMTAEYDVWFRNPNRLLHNLIGNPDFKDEFDYVPYRYYTGNDRQYCNFMSGNWAWKQAVSYLFCAMSTSSSDIYLGTGQN